MTVGGLLLAAGAGRRFGGPKALARLHGQPLVVRGARTLLAAGCEPVLVVVGAEGEAVAAALRSEASVAARIEIVHNRRWSSGMGSSLRAGLAALEGRCAAVAITLVDQPAIGAETVRRLIAAWRAGAPAAVAAYDGRPRNPVVLDAALWPDAAAGAIGDTGARRLLRDSPHLVVEVACDDVATFADVDTPADLRALARDLPPADADVRNGGRSGASHGTLGTSRPAGSGGASKLSDSQHEEPR